MFAFCPIPPLLLTFLRVKPQADVRYKSRRDSYPPTPIGHLKLYESSRGMNDKAT